MRLASATTIVLMAINVGHDVVAQSGPATPAFDVVSIRAVADSSGSFKLSQLDERAFRITAGGQLLGIASLRSMVSFAYGIEPYEKLVVAEQGRSGALEQEFEIKALPPESSSPPEREQVKAMTRQMLVDRFGLRVRIDTELATTTVLRVLKPGVLGPGLRPASDGCRRLPPGARPGTVDFAEAYLRNCVVTFFDDRLRGTVSLDEFAHSVSVFAGRPILNRTELEGTFVIDVAVARASLAPLPVAGRLGNPRPVASNGPDFGDAVRDQMGLTVRQERQPVRRFVVEHVGPLVEN